MKLGKNFIRGSREIFFLGCIEIGLYHMISPAQKAVNLSPAGCCRVGRKPSLMFGIGSNPTKPCKP